MFVLNIEFKQINIKPSYKVSKSCKIKSLFDFYQGLNNWKEVSSACLSIGIFEKQRRHASV